MKPWCVGVLAVPILSTWSGLAPAQVREPFPVVIVKEWHGTLPGDKNALRKLAPRTGYILDQKSWSALWSAWRGGKAPQVNFQTQFVVVGTVRGATSPDGKTNKVTVGQGGPLLARKGNLPLQFAGFDMETPGFAYILAIVQRAGVTSIDGKPLPQPRINPATLESLSRTVELLEKANAQQRVAIEKLRKQIDELKKRN
jgi:hypothetical protein